MQGSARRRRQIHEADDALGPPDKKLHFEGDETPKRAKKQQKLKNRRVGIVS